MRRAAVSRYHIDSNLLPVIALFERNSQDDAEVILPMPEEVFEAAVGIVGGSEAGKTSDRRASRRDGCRALRAK